MHFNVADINSFDFAPKSTRVTQSSVAQSVKCQDESYNNVILKIVKNTLHGLNSAYSREQLYPFQGGFNELPLL